MEAKVGMYQAKVGDWIIGYTDTKEIAIKSATEYEKNIEDRQPYGRHKHDGHFKWYVSKVIDVIRKFEVEDLAQGTPRAVTTYIITGSVVAFGFIDYVSEYKETTKESLSSQGRTRI